MDSGGTPTFGSSKLWKYSISIRSRHGYPATTLSPAGHAEMLSARIQRTLPTGVSPTAPTCAGGDKNKARRRSGAKRKAMRERDITRPPCRARQRARARAREPRRGAEDLQCELCGRIE